MLLAEALTSKELSCAGAAAAPGGSSPGRCRRTPGGRVPISSNLPGPSCRGDAGTSPARLYLHCSTWGQQEMCYPEMAAELLQGSCELLSTAANRQKKNQAKKAICWCCAGEQGASSGGFDQPGPCLHLEDLDKELCFHSMRKFSIPWFMTFIGLQILKICKLKSLRCLALMVAECSRKRC